MLRYKQRNPNPLVKQTEFFFGRNYQSLYDLDRQWAMEYEMLEKRELKHYDRSIELQKEKEQQKKDWIMEDAEKLLSNSPQKSKSFKLSFNKFNGYKVEYNGKCFETFNYLFNDYLYKIFEGDLLGK